MLEKRVLLSAGGGFTDGGIRGEYFPNVDLSGSPTFTRFDNRIDFEWGAAAPGGSNSANFRAVPADGFSARWAGQVIAKYSETYDFITTSDDGTRLYIRPAGEIEWTVLADAWDSGAHEQHGSYAMIAGATYDIRFEYFEESGDATAKLFWSSPSTPLEVVEPLGTAGINLHEGWTQLYADAMKAGRDEWGQVVDFLGTPKIARDENGWPLADAVNIVWEGRDPASVLGTYTLQFNGKADVSVQFRPATFIVDGVDYASLPSGVGYDPITNTTTAKYRPGAGTDILILTFKNTQRTAESAINTGVTNVKLMRPITPGATTSFPTDVLFDTNFTHTLRRFTTQRWLTANQNTTEVNWSDRIKPAYSKVAFSGRPVWEWEVMLANETGKDLYITVPINATTEYVTNLANLIRYGSDGVNPYKSYTESPVYPALNPNLRVYVESSNEVWNWAFTQTAAAANASAQAVANNTPEGRIINFDGKFPGGDFRRWNALKTVYASNAFRAVFGDDEMGNRVRVLLEYQYDNIQDSAGEALSFIDNYFNNADGIAHVVDPHPVSYYLWGAGAAAYFDTSNPRGAQTTIQFVNAGVESPAITPNSAVVSPAGAGWTFNGNSGVYRNATKTPIAASQSLGTTTNVVASEIMSIGYKFTVGGSALGVYDLGRWVVSGNNQSHTIRLIKASDKSTVASATVNTSGATAGAYAYARLSVPVVLSANTTYYLVSSEANGKDTYYDAAGTSLVGAAGITIDGAIVATGTSTNPAAWAYSDGPAGRAYGPVGLRFAPMVGNLAATPDVPEGSQALFIGDTGSISQTINFTKTGVFALEMLAANKLNNSNAIRIYMDGVEITHNGRNIFPSGLAWTPGANVWGRDARIYSTYGSVPFTINSTGNHTLTIVGTFTGGKYTYLDNIRINSVDEIYNANVPNTGYPKGQANYARYAQAFGLNVVAYEGGWAVGGDDSQHAIQTYAAYKDPRAFDSIVSSIDSYARAAGALYMFGTYYHWHSEDVVNSESYPLLEGIDARNDVLPVAPTNGTIVPGGMIPSGATWGRNSVVGTLAKGAWIDWNIIVPTAGTFDIGLITTTGGNVRVLVDDVTKLFDATSGGQQTGSVFLTAGLHTIKVKSLSGSFSVTSVAVAQPGTLFAPAGLSMSLLGSLTWLDTSTGETGFEIQRSRNAEFTADIVTFNVGPGVTNHTDLTGDLSTQYYYRVRATGAGTDSAYSNTAILPPGREPENPFRDKPGLAYTYHEGSWSSVPNFDALTPKKSGSITDFNLTIRDRDDQLGVQYKGWINIAADGMYTFYTTSDDGSKLWIGSTLVVNNDGRHGPQERSGQIRLRAGRHAIKVGFFEESGGQTLSVMYAGPGISKSVIPAAVLSSGGVVNNQPPTIQVAPSAEHSPVTTASTRLSVLGADDGGESELFYTWRVLSKPEGSHPVLGLNGANESSSIDVNFDLAGSYRFEVTVSDLMFEATATVDLVVEQTLATLSIDPASTTISSGGSQQFTTTARDQFGHVMALPPDLSWRVEGNGSIDEEGLYTASFEAGMANVTVSSGEVTGIVAVDIVNDAPVITDVVQTMPGIVTGTTTELSVSASDFDGGGAENLTYTWSVIGAPPGDVQFSDNDSNSATYTTAAFSREGVYRLLVTVTDGGGRSTSEWIDVTVEQSLTSIEVSPSESVAVAAGKSLQFTARTWDQFGQPIAAPIEWITNGVACSVDGTGLFTAGWFLGSFIVTASSADVSTTVPVTVWNGSIFTGVRDIGNVGTRTGSLSVFDGVYTIRGAGAGISGATDAFHFVYMPLTADGEIVARVNSIQNTNPSAKAGLMFRESLAADARNALIAYTPSREIVMQQRTSVGGATNSVKKTAVTMGQWLKIARTGNVVTGYHSPNGTTWTMVGTPVTVAMASTVYVGLAVTSSNTTQLNTSMFSSVAVTPAKPGAPDLVASSDTGASSTDNVTRYNRANGPLTFTIPNTVPGATVGLFGNGMLAGYAVATSTTTTITIPSGYPFSDGLYTFVARQVIGSNAQSGDSPPLIVTIDSKAPAATITTVAPNPRTTSVSSISVTFDGPITGFDRGDLSLTLNGGANLLTPSQTLSTADGRTFTLTGLNSITNASGNYVLKLLASGSGIVDAAGNSIAVDASTNWSINPPVSASAGGPYSVSEGGAVTLNGTASTGIGLSYDWDFDYDGTTFNVDASDATPTLSGVGLDGPATRTVALRVTDSAGASAIATAVLTIVNVTPDLNVLGDDTAIEGLPYLLSLSSSDPGTDALISWTIDWGDGTVDIVNGGETSAGHVYADGPGEALIHVTATDEDGSYDALPTGKRITIANAAPTAILVPGAPVVLGGTSSVSFASVTDSSLADVAAGFSYSFDFNNDGDFDDAGDVFESTSTSASFTYAAAGTHTVHGRIKDRDGSFTDYTTHLSVAPTVVTLGASADAYVRDGSSATTNFGTSAIMEVKKDAVGFNREGYITFDLSSIVSITSAKFRIYGKLSGTMTGGLNAGLYAVADTSWTETGITFNTRPAAAGFLGQVNVGTATGQYYEFDVTTYLQQQKAAGKTSVSFALRALNSGTQLMQFNSKEATGNKPQLVVNQI